MQLRDKSRYLRFAIYYCERANATTDEKRKAKFLKIAAWYTDRAMRTEKAEVKQ